jgi:hypothetical protein
MKSLATARLSILALLVLFLAGCGSGGEKTVCRSYATQFTVSGAGITNGYPNIPVPITAQCAFDSNALQFTCSANYTDENGQASVITKTRGYASLADFVNESTVPGLILNRTFSSANSGFSPDAILYPLYGDGTNTFDQQNRLLTTEHDGSVIQYTSWDDVGRPLTSAPTGICDGDTGIRFEYDDSERTVTKYYNTRTLTPGPGGTVPCIATSTTLKFDQNGNVVSFQDNAGTTFYTVISAETVCVP